VCFSSGQVAYYNKTTLKNLRIFHLIEKFVFFTWAGCSLQQDHFEKSSQPLKPFIWAGRPLQ
jgi:hypothetical protein